MPTCAERRDPRRPAEDGTVGDIIKFPDEGRIVRFGRADAESESATVIILPVIRIERYADPVAESAEPQMPPPGLAAAPAAKSAEPKIPPPAANGGRRRMRRR